jgi:lipopolysaccharide/colanic/teichoic acid biosynthesis glycosyltransferase
MTPGQAAVKRGLDICLAATGLLLSGWLIAIAYIAASIDTGASGFFRQERVGRYGRTFRIIKLRTMCRDANINTTVTTASDPRITRLGRFFRRYKIDELPQLVNILLGDMSFVGPRPDVRGFADELEGEDRIILSVRPGITGPATLRFRNEEQMLQDSDDPERYNLEVVFPEKVKLNVEYIRDYRLWRDLTILWTTLFRL